MTVNRNNDVNGLEVIRLILFIISWILICLVLELPVFEITYDSVAADSFGRIYIGEKSEINVYDDGVKVNEIGQNKMVGVDYYTIKDDYLYLWNNAYFYILDLDGNIIDKKESPLGHEILSPKEKRNFTSEDGNRYELKKGVLCWDRVICTYSDGSEEVVFHMPLWLHLIKMAVRVYAIVSIYYICKSLIKRFYECAG